MRFIAFFAEVEGVEVFALHDLDGVFIDLGISFDAAVVVGLAEALIELGGEAEAVIKVALAERCGLVAILQAFGRIVEDERLEGSFEESTASVLAVTRDDDRAG